MTMETVEVILPTGHRTIRCVNGMTIEMVISDLLVWTGIPTFLIDMFVIVAERDGKLSLTEVHDLVQAYEGSKLSLKVLHFPLRESFFSYDTSTLSFMLAQIKSVIRSGVWQLKQSRYIRFYILYLMCEVSIGTTEELRNVAITGVSQYLPSSIVVEIEKNPSLLSQDINTYFPTINVFAGLSPQERQVRLLMVLRSSVPYYGGIVAVPADTDASGFVSIAITPYGLIIDKTCDSQVFYRYSEFQYTMEEDTVHLVCERSGIVEKIVYRPKHPLLFKGMIEKLEEKQKI